MRTIHNSFEVLSKFDLRKDYKYQKELTEELDSIQSDFNQGVLNEIVLWKVNRYAKFTDETIKLLNQIKNDSLEIDEELTVKVLDALLGTSGVRLAMASTILRFKNPHIYQILDQRVFRFISETGKELKESTVKEKQIEMYLDYLKRLKNICFKYKIDFESSDRILYLMDKDLNVEKFLKESIKVK